MKFSGILSLLLVGSAAAFAPAASTQRAAFGLRMSDEDAAPAAPAAAPASTGGSLVAIKEETVEFTAGLVGGAIGFAVGGPVLGAIGAAAANYASKMDNDVSQVVSAVSKSSIQIYNYLTQLDSKYEILTKAQASLEDSLTKLKAQGTVDPATLEKVENALSSTKSKISELNDEYDLVGASTTAFGVIGDLVEKAVLKAGELNEEYKISNKALDALNGAVVKAKDAAKKA
mmetsp:Transcript_14254/g.23596  ORF Transcript_14254/g.23596 Transcript_14254/m.23596 type:complete len:230 (-) Transcript_14254:128-817(-)|eukprot:CAMPEP_0119007032 /NCGR_PEP_ID=MMETSP1176-20130426/2718_1 /TAXON_ID=265551 /ORGANISM="Synedropsis recta cf, Strain CCMP1620" /LENGTH=229 /DNA_ID=CAMNT_0006959091 /DNA_START=85 /DNA_END=774 /DNA_ORIENTATION=+